MRALLSLCNDKRTPDKGVLSYDFAQKAGTWLPVGTQNEIMGTRGLYVYGERLYALYTVGWYETHLAMYHLEGKAADLVADIQLPDVKDPHSLCVYDNALLITSTGSDELLRYELKRNGEPDDAGYAMWRASDAGSDTHHVNSVAVVKNHVYVSAFGLKTGEFWSSAVDGYIYDVTDKRVILNGLRHPHSLRGDSAGSIYYTESSRQTLCKAGSKPLIIGGYARGCDIAADGAILVGSNAARRVSRSRGVVTNSANPENDAGQVVGKCSVAIVSAYDKPTRQYYDITPFGKEIYDICILE
jgi:hypothetical protein